MLLPRRRGTVSAVLCAFMILMVYYEFIAYYTQALNWSRIPCRQKNVCTRILFVADPHVFAHFSDPKWLRPISGWDSYRFIRNTYQLAQKFFEPDVVVFLGGSFDERSPDNYLNFQQLTELYQNLYPKASKETLYVYNSADQTLGEMAFNVSPRKFKDIRFAEPYVYEDVYNTADTYLFCSHKIPPVDACGLSLLYRPKVSKGVMFSGHTHISTVTKCVDEGPNVRKLTEKLLGNFVFNLNKTLLESVTVPTSSYRVGQARIGFGVAVLHQNDDAVEYTILWLPSRLKAIYSYMCFIIIVLLFVLFKYCYYHCKCLRFLQIAFTHFRT